MESPPRRQDEAVVSGGVKSGADFSFHQLKRWGASRLSAGLLGDTSLGGVTHDSSATTLASAK